MKKYLLLLLPLVVMLLSGCSKNPSLQLLDAVYDTPVNGVLKAEGERFTIKVASTHSFVMTSQPEGVISFNNNGVVTFEPEGVIVDSKHEMEIGPNETGKERTIYIYFTHRRNPEFTDGLIFYQPALPNEEK